VAVTAAPDSRPPARAGVARPRLCYVANIRYPTEKAHGYQISKMCEAFVEEGWEVELWHPHRRQPPETAKAAPGDFYQLRRSFRARALPNIDVVTPALERWRPVSVAAAALQDAAWAWATARRASSAPFDLYYTREPAAAFFLTRRSLPTVLETHRFYENFQSRYLRRLAAAPALRGVVSVTAALKEDLRTLGFSENQILVEHDAVDWDRFAVAASAADCRRRLGLPEDRWIVGYAGGMKTLGFDKGLRQLLTAVGQVNETNGKKPLFLCVGGTAAENATLRAHAAAGGIAPDLFHLQPRVPWKEIPYWLRAADVLCIPWPANAFSSRHTSPLKLFEYMAAGAPILATDLTSLREVLSDGKNAVLAASDRPADLAEGLRRLLSDDGLRQRLAARARADAFGRTWTQRARRIAAAYGEPRR